MNTCDSSSLIYPASCINLIHFSYLDISALKALSTTTARIIEFQLALESVFLLPTYIIRLFKMLVSMLSSIKKSPLALKSLSFLRWYGSSYVKHSFYWRVIVRVAIMSRVSYLCITALTVLIFHTKNGQLFHIFKFFLAMPYTSLSLLSKIISAILIIIAAIMITIINLMYSLSKLSWNWPICIRAVIHTLWCHFIRVSWLSLMFEKGIVYRFRPGVHKVCLGRTVAGSSFEKDALLVFSPCKPGLW